MLLRRFSKHVKDQNWFSIGLFFCIVVAGILTTLQIANWAAANQDREIYEQTRARVIEEARTNLTDAVTLKNSIYTYLDVVEALSRDLEKCDASSEAEERLIKAIEIILFPRDVVPKDPALKLILSSDKFRDNMPPEDRALLSTYAKLMVRISENSQTSRNEEYTRKQLEKLTTLRRDMDAPQFVVPGVSRRFNGLMLTGSYADVCNDRDFFAILYSRNVYLMYQFSQATLLEQYSREMLAELGEIPDPTP